MKPASPTTDYQRQFSSPDCANVILAPGSNKLVCVPFPQSRPTNTLPITYRYPTSSPPSPYSLPAPQMASNSIENLVRSINRERNQKLPIIDTESRIDRKSEEQIQSSDQYYPTSNKATNSYDTNIDDYGGRTSDISTEDNSEECNELGDYSSEITRQGCLKKSVSMKNEHRRVVKKSNQEDEPPADYYLIERDGTDKDGDEVLSSLLMTELQSGSQQAAASKMPAVSLRSNNEILERLPGLEGGEGRLAEERQIDLSEPAILIATRGLNYDQLRLRHPIIKLSHKNGGANKRQQQQQQQQISIDLDGGQRTNKSSLVNQDVTRTSMIRGESNEDYNSKSSLGLTNGPKHSSLECNKRHYTFKAVKRDDSGNKCTGIVRATICYGGCDTGEIADWIFPHKKSVHKVCSHGLRVRRRVVLTECTSNSVDPSLREYHYVDAKSCVCQKCNPADTTCLGSLTRPYLFTDELLLNNGGSGTAGKSNGIESTIPEAGLI